MIKLSGDILKMYLNMLLLFRTHTQYSKLKKKEKKRKEKSIAMGGLVLYETV